jgi:hypothetical protein
MQVLLNTAGFLGLCVGFYIGAWTRVRCRRIWTKALFFFVGWIAGFLAAFLAALIVLLVIFNIAGGIDFSTGNIDVAAARELGRELGAKKIEYWTTAAIGTIAGLISSLGERFGIGRPRPS